MKLSTLDRSRIWWAGARYALWLDLASVPGRTRRRLRAELVANLTDAAGSVGAKEALQNVGSTRALAREVTGDSQLHSPWLAGLSAGIATAIAAVLTFLIIGLYYVQGVLDSGVEDTVSGALFPFPGSQVTVTNAASGFTFEMMPGLVPLIAGALVLIVVAKPWRMLRRSRVRTG